MKNQEFITLHPFRPFSFFLKQLVKMAGKKKWAKGKVREKINNLVVLDQKLHDRLYKEVPKVCLCSWCC